MGKAHRVTPTVTEVLRALSTRVRDDPAGYLSFGLLKRAVKDCAYIGVKKGDGITKVAEGEIVESAERWLRDDLDGLTVAFPVGDALRLAGLEDFAVDMGAYLADLASWERRKKETDC